MRSYRLLRTGGSVTLLFVVIVGAILMYLGRPAQRLEARVQSPPTALVGQPFRVQLFLENSSGDDQEIVSIGLEQALYEQGISISRITPSYERVEGNNRQWVEYTYRFDRRPILRDGETLRMPLTFVATTPGRYRGEIVIWTKNALRNDVVYLDIEVLPAPSPWLGG